MLLGFWAIGCGGGPPSGTPPYSDGEAPFVDVSADAGLDFVHVNGMRGRLYFSEMVGPGGALVDYDGDGDLDVYAVQGHPLDRPPRAGNGAAPLDRLYRNDPVGGRAAAGSPAGGIGFRFVDVTAESGLRATGYGMGVAVGDVDNDGAPDLYVTNHGRDELWRNRGDGRFELRAVPGSDPARWTTSASFLDVDADGWLDLFVTRYVDYRLEAHKPCFDDAGAPDYCGPQSYAPEDDLLLRNRGDGSFEDVSDAAGIAGSPGAALGVVSGDFDGDGALDVYVANDQMRNFLWINDGTGRFTDEALLAGAAVDARGRAQASMGVDAGDLDNDGDEDLFMTHLTGETNTLYRNDGRAVFRDASAETGLGAPSVGATGFGAVFLDFDLDGRLDVAIANGAVKVQGEQRRAGEALPLRQPNQLFHNRGDTFVEVGRSIPALARSEVSRGLAVGDLDHDGDVDLLLLNNNGPARLLLNRATGRGWVGARVLTRSGRDALGARVGLVDERGARQWRRVRTDGSYCSANDPRVAFGLGEDSVPVTVEVWRPGGGVTRYVGLPADRLFVLADVATEREDGV